MVFAVATFNSVLIYNTISTQPIFLVSNIHFAALSDLSWNSDQALAISSLDGYITFCIFEKGELGTKQPDEEYPESLKEIKKKIQDQIDSFEPLFNLDKFQKIEENKQKTYIRKDGKKVIVPKKITYAKK